MFAQCSVREFLEIKKRGERENVKKKFIQLVPHVYVFVWNKVTELVTILLFQSSIVLRQYCVHLNLEIGYMVEKLKINVIMKLSSELERKEQH